MHMALNGLATCGPLPQAGRLGVSAFRSSAGNGPRAVAAAAHETAQLRKVALTAEEINRGNFQPFGQVDLKR